MHSLKNLKLSEMTKRTIFSVFFAFVLLMDLTFADKHFSRGNNSKKQILDEEDVATSIGGCGGCKFREELKNRNLEVLKQELLQKMGFKHPPNVTGKVLPAVPSHILDDFAFMQADQPEFKAGISVHEDEDEYHVKTQKIVTFAKQHPRLRHNTRGHEILHFQFSDAITKFHVANASLFFYIKGAERRPLPDVHIEIYKVLKIPDAHSDMPIMKKIFSKKQSQPFNHGDWIRVDLTETVSEWFKNSRENHGFVLNATVNGRKILVSDSIEKTPYVEVSTTESRRRIRRSQSLNCNDSTQETLCCRYPMTVDFVKFGWDFIIAPKKYQAHYCSGECPFLSLQKYPHTHLVKMTQNSAQPCCSPRKMSAISMLYFDEQYNVVYGSLPGMVVDRCGCA